MFGQGIAIKHGTRAVLEGLGCDEDDAKVLGRLLGWTVAICTFDVASMAEDIGSEVVSCAGEGAVSAGASAGAEAVSEGAEAASSGSEVSFCGDPAKIAEYERQAEYWEKEAENDRFWGESYARDGNHSKAESFFRSAAEKAAKAAKYASDARFEANH